jgi:hypothetical protein
VAPIVRDITRPVFSGFWEVIRACELHQFPGVYSHAGAGVDGYPEDLPIFPLVDRVRSVAAVSTLTNAPGNVHLEYV